MANTHKSNDDEKIVKKSIQRLFERMFSRKQSRLVDSEANKRRANNEKSPSIGDRQKQIAQRTAGILTAISLAFFGFALYNLFILQKGQADLADRVLVLITILMVLFSLISFRLIRHDRFALGGWVLFLTNTIFPPALASLFIANITVLVGGYLVIFSLLSITLVLSAASRLKAVVATVIAALAIYAIELWNPSFRVYAAHLETLTSIVGVAVLLAICAVIVRQTMTGNIRTKLISMFVVVAVLSMAMVAFLADQSLRNSLSADIVESQISLASSQGFQVGQAIIGQFDKLKGLATVKTLQVGAETASLEETRPVDTVEIEQLNLNWRETVAARDMANPLVLQLLYNPLSTELKNFQKTFPENVEVLLTDQKGFSIAATNLPSNYYQADTLWWRTAHTTGRYIGQPTFNPTTNSIALDIAVPVFSYRNGDFVGVLRATVAFDVLTDLLAEGFRGQTGYSLIYQPTDQEIRLQSLENGNYEIIQDFASTDLQKFASSSSQSMEFFLEGVPVLASSAPVKSYSSAVLREGTTALDDLDWKVIVLQNKSEALQSINTQTRNNLILTLLVSIVVIIIAYLLARFITNPIIQLNTVALKVASGDLSAEAKIHTTDEVGTLAATFNNMTLQLRNLIGSLEQRVQDRTHDLELASEVGRTITENVANAGEMLTAAAEMIRSRFGLYYTQVYLTNEAGQHLILRAGTGGVGEELLKRGHRLPIDSNSLNGQAVLEKKPIIVADTQQSPNFRPNPLLPQTRSEMAVPLIVGNQVIGVLDMQSDRPGALSESNLPAFQALAGQLAIAIQNAALFAEAQQARAEVELQIRRFTEESWQDFLDAIHQEHRIGYAFDESKVIRLKSEVLSTLSDADSLHLPLTVAGTKIGAVHLPAEAKQTLSASELEFVQAAGAQLAQHVENLRLLAQAERFRKEAEQVTRRLTREGWEFFLGNRDHSGAYIYDLNQVRPFSGNGSHPSQNTIKQSLIVRDEPIGELAVNTASQNAEDVEILESVAKQLSAHLENLRLLEQNEKRAYELASVAAVSTTTSTLLDPDRLLQTVVDLAKERFGLYHAHIYLANEAWNTLLLAAGAGEVGRQMVSDGWNISIDHEHSIVASAARDRQPVIANDVVRDTNSSFLSNQLLPDTRSEMAVPMIVGDQVLGVFDVQADTVNYFSGEDATIFTTLAAQIAVALQNARLYVKQAATLTQLRELDRLKSSFLANMSHELRTPLNSILGFTDVMLEGLDGPLTEYMDNDLRLVQKNGQHLLHLINDVLDMAKIEAGRMNLNPEVFKVHEVFDEVTSITSALANEKQNSVLIDNCSDREIEIYADRTRLRQVMINLVNNANKFTENGKITLNVSPMDGARVQITVMDDGLGIPPEKLEAIFQEFTQVDSSTTRKTGGTGLGLPISRRLVEMHGGRLWAESTGIPGEGSMFFVELPLEARITEVMEKEEK
jgi:signal transduction histidine kinase/HAMP domain-containing protein